MGDSLKFSFGPATGTWTVLLAARQPGSANDGFVRSATSSDVAVGPDGATVEIPTTNWANGLWLWTVRQVLNGVHSTVATGEVRMWPAIHASTGAFVETRTEAELTLMKLRETLQRWNDQGWVQQQAIQGRSLSRYTLTELRELEQTYALRVRQERIARGLRVKPRYVTMRPR